MLHELAVDSQPWIIAAADDAGRGKECREALLHGELSELFGEKEARRPIKVVGCMGHGRRPWQVADPRQFKASFRRQLDAPGVEDGLDALATGLVREVVLSCDERGIDDEARCSELALTQELLENDVIVATWAKVVAQGWINGSQEGAHPCSLPN